MALQEKIKLLPSARMQALKQRVQALYRQANSSVGHDVVLSTAFDELEVVLEHLEAADEALQLQHEEFLNSRAELELECQRYKDQGHGKKLVLSP